MIVYSLMCDQDHEFESWFSDSAAYDRLARRGQVSCPHCGSTKVRKAPMAPRIKKSADDGARVMKMMRQIQKKIEETCEPVGDRFAEEARKIHYGETEARGIYGETTLEEARALVEEGVEFGVIPWRKREDA